MGLRVADLDRAEDFYARTIGLRPLPRRDGLARLSADGVTPLIELEPAGGPPAPRDSTGLFHLAILHPSRAELGRAVQRVLDAGVRLTGASDHLVSEAVYLDDPDGSGIELYRDRAREDWPRTADGGVAMATEPLDLAGVLAAAPTGPGSEEGVAPGAIVGHVHLKVSDLERSVAFYSDALGLTLQARWRDQAAFLAAGDYHHHLGVNVWHSRGAGPPPPGSSGLAFHTFTLPSHDELDATVAGLDAAGHASRRANGAAVVPDPDGIELRLELARQL